MVRPTGWKTVVADRETGRRPIFVLKPDLMGSIRELLTEHLAEEGRRIAALSDDRLFTVTKTAGGGKVRRLGCRRAVGARIRRLRRGLALIRVSSTRRRARCCLPMAGR